VDDASVTVATFAGEMELKAAVFPIVRVVAGEGNTLLY